MQPCKRRVHRPLRGQRRHARERRVAREQAHGMDFRVAGAAKLPRPSPPRSDAFDRRPFWNTVPHSSQCFIAMSGRRTQVNRPSRPVYRRRDQSRWCHNPISVRSPFPSNTQGSAPLKISMFSCLRASSSMDSEINISVMCSVLAIRATLALLWSITLHVFSAA